MSGRRIHPGGRFSLRRLPNISAMQFLADLARTLRVRTPFLAAGRITGWSGVALSLSAVAANVAITFVSSDSHRIQAQQLAPPTLEGFVFGGNITINGAPPAYTGFRITARIGDQWESPHVTVGANPNKPFQYDHLLVTSSPDLGLIGSKIEFWLDGQVKSSTTQLFACVVDGVEIPEGCLLFHTTPVVRQLDLDFPFLPAASPTVEPPPTPFDDLEPPPLPIGFPPLVFRGAVTINNETPADAGLQIVARVGSLWESTPARVRRTQRIPVGYSHLEIQPPEDLDLNGATIEFWLDGKVKADATSVFAPLDPSSGEFCAECPWTFPELRTLNLNFPHHPNQPPPPTPAPSPVSTPMPPITQYPIFLFYGEVTINGQQPSRSGFEVTARIGEAWRSAPAIVGSNQSKPYEYAYLVITPDEELDLIGSHIEFWIADQVKSRTVSVFAILPGELCEGCLAYPAFPILRKVDLDFPRLPILTPTPLPTAIATNTPTPTASPSPTPTATLTATPTSTPTPTHSPSPTKLPTLTPTATPQIPTETPLPTKTPSPSPSPAPTTAIPELTATPLPPTATATLVPAPTPSPTPSPVPPTPSSTPIPPTVTPSPIASPTSVPTPIPFIPPAATPASTDPDKRANATTGLTVLVLLMVLALLAYIRWRVGRRSHA